MPYIIAGIDVHKKVLVVVVAEVTEQGEWTYERGTFGATAYELQRLVDWFQQQGVQEVVMESSAQYWRPVWGALEQYWTPVMRQREATMLTRFLHPRFMWSDRIKRLSLAKAYLPYAGDRHH